jgi:hypothetical protein
MGFKKNQKNFDSAFTNSNLKEVETISSAYTHLFYALFLQDALPYIKLVEFKGVPYADAVAVIDT